MIIAVQFVHFSLQVTMLHNAMYVFFISINLSNLFQEFKFSALVSKAHFVDLQIHHLSLSHPTYPAKPV